nr:MAG TPA: hypothetical protein [Bacteriophage sp.]
MMYIHTRYIKGLFHIPPPKPPFIIAIVARLSLFPVKLSGTTKVFVSLIA